MMRSTVSQSVGKKGEGKRIDLDVSGHSSLLSISPLLEMSWGGEEQEETFWQQSTGTYGEQSA